MSLTIIYCPVCGRNIKHYSICPMCGYDKSRDYELYPTLTSMPLDGSSISIKHQEWEDKRIEEKLQLFKKQIASLTMQVQKLENQFQNHLGENQINSTLQSAEENIQGRNMEIAEAREQINDLSSQHKTMKTANNPQQMIFGVDVVKEGGIIRFGHYEQRFGITPIEWRVLKVLNSRILLITKMAIECKAFNEEFVNSYWKTCSLRKWLNSEFLNLAFTANERERIITSSVICDENETASRKTSDKVFLLSAKEAKQFFYLNIDRRCHPTAYTKNQGAQENNMSYCWWWLRSSGNYRNLITSVKPDGSIHSNGIMVNDKSVCVRPALWINLEF